MKKGSIKKGLTILVTILSIFLFNTNNVKADISLIGQSQDFSCTQTIQPFTATVPGGYKLEVWGAQGGSAGKEKNNDINYMQGGNYGYGGYSVGTVQLSAGQTIYVAVGCCPYNSAYGGYNGGGNGTLSSTCTSSGTLKHGFGGGGATHISKTNTLLKDTPVGDLLIAAGGSGGGPDAGSVSYPPGGNGGGYSGLAQATNSVRYGKGGSQTSAGTCGYYSVSDTATNCTSGGYGYGASAATSSQALGAGGGGGGYYGGGAGYVNKNFNSASYSGGGGSGYIGNSLLTDKHMTCLNCSASDDPNTKTINLGTSVTNMSSETPVSDKVKLGHGAARITLVSELPDGRLKLLKVTGAFTDQTLISSATGAGEYNVTLNKYETSVNITAQTVNPNSSVSFDSPVNTSARNTSTFVYTTASDGSVMVYKINLYRPANDITYATDLTYNGTTIPGFDKDTLEYTINQNPLDETATFTLGASLYSSDQTVTGTGTYNYEFGTHDYEVTVTSEDRTATRTYTIHLVKNHTTKLKLIELDNHTLSPTFDGNTLNYTTTIGSMETSVVINKMIPYDEGVEINSSGHKFIRFDQNGLITVTVSYPGLEDTVYTINALRDGLVDNGKWGFDCTGHSETWTVPETRYYILETWGAQGGHNGGKGGYTSTKVKLIQGTEVYITVGCQGSSDATGGYNGGGYGSPAAGIWGVNSKGGGGGGATHIAINSNLGTLNRYSNNKSDVLIVAGGGGGGNHNNRYGGAGGGNAGVKGGNGFSGAGGGQSGGGGGNGWLITGGSGSFGSGGSASNITVSFILIVPIPKYSAGGGGGGWYGGGGGDTSFNSDNPGGGGGGSGYINKNSGLKTKATSTIDGNSSMPTYQGGYSVGKTGNGFATITQAEYPSNNNNLKDLNIIAIDETTLNETKKDYTPELSGSIEDYYVHLNSNETKVIIDANVEDGDAELISGPGTYYVDETELTVKIIVKADNGDIKEHKVHFTRDLDTNSKPLDIKIEGLVPNFCSQSNAYCNLNPEFNPDTNEYEMLVPGRIDTLKFVVEKAHKNQTVTGDGSVYLSEEENYINIRVTSEDGSSSSVYRYKIDRDLDGSPYLETIKVLDPNIDLGYSKTVFDYYITVPNEYDRYVDNGVDAKDDSLENVLQLYIKPEGTHTTYALSGDGTLKFGNNKISVMTTARNGEVAVYNLNVYRSKDISTLLSSLEVYNQTEKVELIPEYNKLKYSYRGEVNETVESINIVATPEDSRSTVSGDGIQNLNPGKNTFPVIITSPAGDIETYVINIYRTKENNNYLSSLVVKNGEEELTYEPEFNKETYEYNLEVDYDVNKLDIIGTPESEKANVLNLYDTLIKVGNNKKTIYVYAEDGSKREYVVNVLKKGSLENRLSDLKIYDKDGNELSYEPTFDKETFAYTLEVENEIDSVRVEATKINPKAELTGNGVHALAVGYNPVHVGLIVSGEEPVSYTVLITRKSNANAYLQNITLSDGELTPVFNKETLEYTVNVDGETSEIEITGEPELISTTVTGNGKKELTTGDNNFELVTMAEDGETSLTYKLKVVKPESDNNNIKSLILEEGGLTPTFEPSVTSYSADVPYEVTSGTFRVELEDEKATYEILNNENFVEGENEVTIRVTSESGKTKDYVVTINRQQESTSNYLASLSVTEGTLTPVFDKHVQFYEVEVESDIESLIIEAEPEYASSTVTGTGLKVLSKGKNLYVVRVTDKNNVIRDYQVLVNRKGNNEARLKTLEMTSEILSPAFDKDTYSYSTSTANTSLVFKTIEPLDENATYIIKNNSFVDVGDYTVTIEVTAEDKVTKKEYNITVTKRQSDNTNLSYLGVEGYSIVPEFDKTINMYTLTVPSDVNAVNIIAKAEDPNATINGTGVTSLVVGENNKFVTVTSESGNTKTYTIKITREGSSNNRLKTLDVLNGTISPTYSNDIYEYDVEIPYEENIADLYYELEDDDARVSIIGNEDLKVGLNEVTMTVTATNGDVRVINLHVTKKNPVSSLLKTLKVNGYEINPEFNSYLMNYEVEVNNETESLDMVIETLDPDATYVVRGNNLEVGSNEVTIEVTASDNVTKSTYTINVTRDEYVNNFLLYLFTNRGDLTPEFNARTNEYSITVENKIEDIDIIAKAENTTATVTTPNPTINTDTYDGLVGRFALEPGENKIYVVVTTEDAHTRKYIINVNREKNDDNYLQTLKVLHEGRAYDLVPEFNKETQSYTLSVPSDIENVTITGTPHNERATISGLGEKTVNFGDNTFPVVVTAEDGSTRTYIVVVNRALSSINNLFLLEPSSGELEPEFDGDTPEYDLVLDESVSTLWFDYIAEDKYSVVEGTEEQVVPDGRSVREIVVTAENGDTKTYTVNVIKQRKDNALLSDLYVIDYPFVNDQGEEVTFDKDTYDYYIKVPYSKAALNPSEVVYETEDERAVVQKDGTMNLLTTNDNIYKVKVTAQDGFTTNIYSIHVEREKNNNALLSSFEAKVGNLNKEFIPTDFEYVWTLDENKEITPLDVTYTLMDENAKATPTDSVTYVEGENNAFEIEVTSEDGTVTNTYRFVLELNTNEKPYLKSLTASVGTLEPEFNKEINTYDLYEYDDVESVTISAEPEDPTSTVTGTGEVTLSSEFIRREITVTGTNGETNVYVVNIHKVVPRDDHLDDLGLNGLENVQCVGNLCTLSPTFDPEETSYEIKVPMEYDKLDVYYKLNNDHQTVEITVDGNEYVKGMDITTEEVVVTLKVYNGLKELANTYTMKVIRKDIIDITTPEEVIPVPQGEDYELPTNTIPKDSADGAAVTFKLHNGEEDIIKHVTKNYTPNGWLVNDVHYDDKAVIKVDDDITLVPDYIETLGGVEFPSDPRKENYAFTGWFDEETGGTEYTSYNENEEFTLHAQYTDDYVVITIPDEDPIPVPKGEDYELPTNDKEKDDDTITVTFKYQNGEDDTESSIVKHYEPNGWLINGVHYDDKVIITPEEDILLVPDYTETIIPITLPEPTWDKHDFQNWNSEEDGTGTVYTNESINELNSDTTVYAIWTMSDITISFDSHGAGDIDSITRGYNAKYGELPTPTKEGYLFDGWYKEDTYENKVSSETKATEDITLHAKWVEDPFPIVYEDEEEEFDGTNYLNTHIRLYSEENASKDYEIGFTIEEFDESIQEKYATFTQDMYELGETGYPGLVVRFDNRDNIFKTDIRHNRNSQGDYGSVYVDNYPVIKKVRIVRKDGVIYYSTNDGELAVLHNFNNFTNYFETEATFGAALDENNSPFRFIKGKLSNMYVRLGDYPEKEKEYDYTGREETFIAPKTGYYKLQTWGAQGGSTHGFAGGYGGYSEGNVYLHEGDILYINVGEQGASASAPGESLAGGYNGGGSVTGDPSVNHYITSGGGATHIATTSGLLSTLENNKDSILIVSGAGGGATWQENFDEFAVGARQGPGGSGGGSNGLLYFQTDINSWIETTWLDENTAIAGTQAYGYAFGQGASNTGGSAGGGGFYGGKTYQRAGAGGSGYIDNPLLTDKHMTMYATNSDYNNTEFNPNTSITTNSSETPVVDTPKGGNGYAKITYIPETHTVTYPDGNIEVYEHNTIVNLDSNESTKDSEELATVTFKYHDDNTDDTTASVTKNYTSNGFMINGVHYDDKATLVVDEDKVITDYFDEELVSPEFPVPEREYYVFDGWYTEEEGGEKLESYNGEEDITLHAHWEHETVTITYPDQAVVVPKGEYYELLPTTTEKEPDIYTVTFKYHNGNEDTTSEVKQYYYTYGWEDQNGNSYWNNDSILLTEDLTLSLAYYEDYSDEAEFPENPTREGYAFLGWFDEEEGGNKYTEYSEKENITLHAHWTNDLVTITIPGEDPIPVPRGEEFELPVNEVEKDPENIAEVTFKPHNGEDDIVRYVTKTFTPNGWLIDGIHFDNNKVIKPTKDITLVPDYTERIEGVTFPSNPTKEDETFVGWFDEEDGGKEYTSYKKEEDITLHAQYGEGTYAYLITGYSMFSKFRNYGDGYDTFRKATLEEYNLVKDSLTNDNIISTNDSPMPAYLWGTGSDVVYYSEADIIYMNRDSGHFFSSAEFTNIDVSGLNTSKVVSMHEMFYGVKATSLDLSTFDTHNVTDMQGMFRGNYDSLTSINISNWDTSNVTNMSYMFWDCRKLTNIDVSGLNTSNVTNMQRMFSGCKSLTSLNLSTFDTHNVTNMEYMFAECESLTSLSLDGLDTSNVTNMGGLFYGCSGLTSVDLSNLDTSKTENMTGFFSGCTSLTNIDLSDLDISNVTSFHSMFRGCSNLETITWSKYVNRKAYNLSYMFNGLSKIEELDISNLYLKNSGKKDFDYVFADSPNLKTIYATRDAWPVSTWMSEPVFGNNTSLVGGEGTTFDSSMVKKQYARVDDPDNGYPAYFTDVSTIKEQHAVTYHYKNGDIVEHYNHNSILRLDVNDSEVSLDSLGTITFKYHDGITEDTKSGAFAISTPNGWLVNDVHYDDSSLITIDEDKDVYYDSIVNKDTAEFPEDPTRTGYTFLGWFTEEEGGEKVESYEGEEDIVLHAHWEETSLPTDLDIDAEDVTIVVGETHQIGVTFIPDGTTDTLTFTNYDNEKISVTEEGLVTGLEAGTTEITVGLENASDVTKTITVTVINNKITSQVLDVKDKTKARIIIGEEPNTSINDFLDKIDNPREYLVVYDKDDNIIDSEDYETALVTTGTKVKLVINGIEHDEVIAIIRGDLNEDGRVNVMDLSKVSDHILEKELIEGYKLYAADLVEDENAEEDEYMINVMDQSKFVQYILENIDSLNE